jgi:hypothetical protein
MSASSPPVANPTADMQVVSPPLKPASPPEKHDIADKVNHISGRVDTLDHKVNDIEKTLVTSPTVPIAPVTASAPSDYNDLFEFL